MDNNKETQKHYIVTSADQSVEALATLNRAVRNARRYGLTWAEIGEALGTTKQAAQQRFGPTTGETK